MNLGASVKKKNDNIFLRRVVFVCPTRLDQNSLICGLLLKQTERKLLRLQRFFETQFTL